MSYEVKDILGRTGTVEAYSPADAAETFAKIQNADCDDWATTVEVIGHGKFRVSSDRSPIAL